MKDILNAEEQSKVIFFNQDEVLKGAIKKIFLQYLYTQGVIEQGKEINNMNWAGYFLQMNPATSNEILGQDLRAKLEALKFIASAFSEIEKYKSEPKPNEEENNPALGT